MPDYYALKSFPSLLSFTYLDSKLYYTVVYNHLRGNKYTSIRVDNGAGIIVRFTPWNETSSRKRNNIVDKLRYLSYFFFFFVIYYVSRI